MWREGKKCRSSQMCLNVNDYHFKTSRYRSTYLKLMVTTYQKPIRDKKTREKGTQAYHYRKSSNQKVRK